MLVLLTVLLFSLLGPTRVLWGVSFGPMLRGRMPVLTARIAASVCLALLSSLRRRESWLSESLPGACSALLSLLMPHTRALTLPSEICGGRICLPGLRGMRMLFCLWMLMPAWGLLCPGLLGAVVSANRRIICSGFLFHRTMVELGLRVPATFGAVGSTAFTWVSNGGAAHRIHYVAVPFTWDCDHGTCSRHSVAPREVRVAPSSMHVVGSAADWEDHFLVALHVRLAIRWAPRGDQWKVVRESCRPKKTRLVATGSRWL